MFLPKAFYNGGLLFSILGMIFIAAVSLYSFLSLVETRNAVPAGFGDMGGVLFGSKMRMAVLVCITLSQVSSHSAMHTAKYHMRLQAQHLLELFVSSIVAHKHISSHLASPRLVHTDRFCLRVHGLRR
jgi:hypothetical protein